MEEKVTVVLQRKDYAKRWKKRYTKEMNIKMAFLLDQAIQQSALPPEQRPVSLEQVYKAAGIQIGKYEVGPYLEEMKDKIEISYPQDILAIISERKKAAAAGSSSSGIQSDFTHDPALPPVQSLLSNVTPEPALYPVPVTSDQPETNSAIGK